MALLIILPPRERCTWPSCRRIYLADCDTHLVRQISPASPSRQGITQEEEEVESVPPAQQQSTTALCTPMCLQIYSVFICHPSLWGSRILTITLFTFISIHCIVAALHCCYCLDVQCIVVGLVHSPNISKKFSSLHVTSLTHHCGEREREKSSHGVVKDIVTRSHGSPLH